MSFCFFFFFFFFLVFFLFGDCVEWVFVGVAEVEKFYQQCDPGKLFFVVPGFILILILMVLVIVFFFGLLVFLIANFSLWRFL